ncbi:MAG: YceI family protein [Planctomycetota bacterium]
MRVFRRIVWTLAAMLVLTATSHAADTYTLDPSHAGMSFMVSHLGLSYCHGRFNELAGEVEWDEADPSKSKFTLTAKTESVDTGNQKRDDHLRSPDFFNAKQFPTIEYRSTSVKAVDGGFEVAGNLTMHGVTKPVTFTVKGGKKAEFPAGTQRIGFSTRLTLKRSEFDITGFQEAIGDDVFVAVSFEAIKK